MHSTAVTMERETPETGLPARMLAAVYRGRSRVPIETVPVPEILDGEILLRVHACGVCGTDLKKIQHELVPPPRIFGHETAGTVVRVGHAVRQYKPGDRVAVHHHVPCGSCFYCDRRLFSQCELYRRTGTTAGFEPAGGGFAEYVRVMDWIVERGTVRIPPHVTFEEASFLEPLNTCLKALETARLEAGEVIAIFGQGPVGLLLLQAAASAGARVIGLDLMERRLQLSRKLGAEAAFNPSHDGFEAFAARRTDGRGVDLAVVATANPSAVLAAQKLVRRGGRVLLFAQTVPGELLQVDASRVCMEEKQLIGSYSASIELQDRAADLIFSRKIDVARLVSHRFGLDRLSEGVELASHPTEESLKVVIQP